MVDHILECSSDFQSFFDALYVIYQWSKIKDDIQVVFQFPCLSEHPVAGLNLTCPSPDIQSRIIWFLKLEKKSWKWRKLRRVGQLGPSIWNLFKTLFCIRRQTLQIIHARQLYYTLNNSNLGNLTILFQFFFFSYRVSYETWQ